LYSSLMIHIPVLLEKVLEALNPQSGELFIDATIGAGGHTRAFLEKTAPDGKVLGIDASPKAIDHLKKELQSFGNRLFLAQGNFRELKKIAYDNAMDQCDGILLDLGFSSDELDDPSLGISFRVNGPLDMRFSGEGETAAEIVNTYPVADLMAIIRKYGQERYARPIAEAIVRSRKHARIFTTQALVKVIADAVPAGYERGRIHPATRTFQALRITVNDELGSLETVLPQAVEVLRSGGKLAVISFHSLEDRIVKRFFRDNAGTKLRVMTKRPIQAGEEELARNPRARSAKLRVAEKI